MEEIDPFRDWAIVAHVRQTRFPVAAILIGAALIAPTAMAAQGEQAVPAATPTAATVFSTSRVIVEWMPGADHGDRVDARDDAEVDFESDLGNRSFQLVEVQAEQTARDAIEELRESPAVALAERDASVSTNSIPDDPLFGELWGLQNTGIGIEGFSGALAGADVNVPAAWDQTVGTEATVIADIDTGYRFEHPDLANVAWTNPLEIAGNSVDDDGDGIVDDVHGADFIGNNGDAPTIDGNPTDEDLLTGGHGVHTAGTIGAQGNNGIGITGVAQDVRIMPLRVCARFPSLSANRCSISSIVAAINYASAHHAKVANMSLGGNNAFQSEVNAIAEAKETLFVISAGNDGSDNDGAGAPPHGHHYPCDFTPQTQASPPVSGAIDNIICVAATDQADGLAGFSDWGATSVDLGAPGTETLSTFPVRHFVDETFEADDFGSKWTATGSGGGFARTNEAPLTSFGMADSPGTAPAAGSTRESTSAAVAVPAGFSNCTLFQNRTVSLGGGNYTYQILLNGSSVGSASPSSSSGLFSFSLGNALQGGGNVQLRFRYTAADAPAASDGVWLDDIDLQCAEPVGQASGYAFLQGTSMAAPHVTGAAGLLFSLKPLATVTEVKNALLSGVDAVPSLAGKTTTGGRLDIAKAMDSLEGNAVDHVAPAAPSLFTVPDSGTNDNNPKIKGSAEAGSTVTLFKGLSCTGGPVVTVTAAQLAGSGIDVTVPDNTISFFSAIAIDAARNKSACATTSYLEDSPSNPPLTPVAPDTQTPIPFESPPSSPPPPPPTCKVPKVVGLTLGQATTALSKVGCKLGTVTKPKAKRGHRLPVLVVKSSSPAAGATTGGKANLTLGPKPKPKRHHH